MINSVKARAKINLALDVVGLRPDNFHTVDMIMATLAIHDLIQISANTRHPRHILKIEGTGTAAGLLKNEKNENNLVVQAAEIVARHVPESGQPLEFTLHKLIPVAAGLGGGSSDAAAIIRALVRHFDLDLTCQQLCDLAAQLGSDVPFFLKGGLKRATGRGEILQDINSNITADVVLIKPDFSLSTPLVYRTYDEVGTQARPDIEMVIKGLLNDDVALLKNGAGNALEKAAFHLYPELAAVKEAVAGSGAWLAQMSGSGPTIFGLYEVGKADDAADLLKRTYPVYDVLQTYLDLSLDAV